MSEYANASREQLLDHIRSLQAQLELSEHKNTTTQAGTDIPDQTDIVAAERQARHVAELLHHTGEVLARAPTLDEILEAFLDTLEQLIHYDSANIMLREGLHTFRVHTMRGYERWTTPALLENAPFDIRTTESLSTILRERRSLVIHDTRQDPGWRMVPGTEHIACWMGVPLIAGNEVVGIYSLDMCQPNTLRHDALQMAEVLAAMAATAIGRVQLLTQLQDERALLARRVDERTYQLQQVLDRIQMLHAITNAVITSDDLAASLQYTVDQVCAILRADRILLLTFDSEAQEIAHGALGARTPGLIYEPASFDQYMAGLTGWAIRERRIAFSPNGSLDPRESHQAQQRRQELHCGCIIVVPLFHLDIVFGTLTAIHHDTDPDFSKDDIELLEAVANQIAIVYARSQMNARLRQANADLEAQIAARIELEATNQRNAERADALAMLSRMLSEVGLEQQPIFDMIAHQITLLLGDACMVSLSTNDGRSRQIVAIDHRDPIGLQVLQSIFPKTPTQINQNLLEHVYTTGQAQRGSTLSQEQIRQLVAPELHPYLDQFSVSSMMVVAMNARGRQLGVISVIRSQTQSPYSTDDQTFLQALADRAGLAIENARLFAVAERARAEAESAAQLKDDFLASMSHELRTPLSAILGRAELLSEEVYGPLLPRQHDALSIIDESGRHLLALINDILDLSKIEAGQLQLEPEDLLVQSLCQASLTMIGQAAHAKHITVTSTLESTLTVIHADVRRLKQILVNLLSNAVKFTPSGGKIGLDVYGDQTDQTVTFTVWDTGIGIAPASIPRLFTPFFQIDSSLNRQYNGTGLGLALVRRLAKAHGGTVTVESTLGQGSRFCVTIPWIGPSWQEVAIYPQHETTTPQTTRPQLSRTIPLILLAEDHPENIALIQDYLVSRGYQIITASDGATAIAHARATRPDLILMDIQMPGIDGLEAIQHIRTIEALRTTPIIALTALAMPGDRERCLAAGANEYLTKPIRLQLLLSTIEANLC